MNILFLRSNPVNPDSRVEKEVNSLLKVGHKITIFCWDREEDYKVTCTSKKFENGSVDIYRLGIKAMYGGGMKKNLLPLLKFQIGIFRFIKRYSSEIDIIHACDFDTGLVAKYLTTRYKKYLVYDIFDFYVDSYHVPSRLKTFIKKMEFSVINSSDATILCTEDRMNQIEGSNPKQIEIIHNTPPNCNQYNSNVTESFSIGYVGVLGGGRLIEELVEIVIKHKDITLNIGGFGKLADNLEKQSEKHKNINFLGKISYEEVLELESNSTILTAIYDPKIPNHKYAAPNKFYEGLMLGKPLIMVKGTGMSDLVRENKIGCLIDYDIESLEEAILGLKELNSLELSEIKSKMQKIYNQAFSWDVMEDRLIKLYEGLGEK